MSQFPYFVVHWIQIAQGLLIFKRNHCKDIIVKIIKTNKIFLKNQISVIICQNGKLITKNVPY